jgi:hypothetical protein
MSSSQQERDCPRVLHEVKPCPGRPGTVSSRTANRLNCTPEIEARSISVANSPVLIATMRPAMGCMSNAPHRRRASGGDTFGFAILPGWSFALQERRPDIHQPLRHPCGAGRCCAAARFVESGILDAPQGHGRSRQRRRSQPCAVDHAQLLAKRYRLSKTQTPIAGRKNPLTYSIHRTRKFSQWNVSCFSASKWIAQTTGKTPPLPL